MQPVFDTATTAGILRPFGHVDQRGRGDDVVIPDVVMRHLKVPLQFAGVGVERQDRRRKQILARAHAAEVSGRGLANREEHQAPLRIDGTGAPIRRRAGVIQ